ncbi:MAG: carboxypeptidase regulatory-like domain-containing protein [Methanomassiliicoccales archaeon]|nr:MAG: carboxypeptidase regulatory-like domain-containing protein [Methanomassiliicoccales archaeon]
MASAFAEGTLLCKKRLISFVLTSIFLISSLYGISLSAKAQSENVFVDGYAIVNGTGIPIDNATILLEHPEGYPFNSTKTDLTGYYNMSIYTEGNLFKITAFHDDYLVNSTYIWLSPWNNRTVEINLEPATEKGSWVNGRILDAVSMTPIPQLGVAAINKDYINTTSTNSTGHYLMKLQSNLSYLILVENDDYMKEYVNTDLKWGDNLTFDFLLEPINCTLKGNVKNASGPLGSAEVRVYRPTEYGSTEYWPEVNPLTGYFELNLSRGVWQVEVHENDHFIQALTVLMFNNLTTWQNFTLLPLPSETATVQGYVKYYDNGSVVPWAGIWVSNLNGSWYHHNNTDATGWYSVSVIPGELMISPGWIPDYWGIETTLSVENQEIYFLNLTVYDPKENCYLDGYVKVNGTGEPGVQVYCILGWNSYNRETDPAGYYNFTVPAAPFEVQAIKEGYTTAFSQVNTTAFQTTRLNLTIESLNRTMEVRGFVNDTSGLPIENAYVILDFDGWGNQESPVTTDYTGFYQCMVPPGNSSYYIIAEGYEYAMGEVYPSSEQVFWLNETLSPINADANIICRLTEIYSGKPIKHVGLRLSEQDLQWYDEVETNDNGVFKATVPSGIISLNFDATRNGFKYPGRLQFLVKPGETRWLNISLYPLEKTALLYGYVNDTGNSPISNATVYAMHGDTIVTYTTNTTGYYELFLPGDHELDAWVRAPHYKIEYYWEWVGSGEAIHHDWVLEDSNAWIEKPITDSVSDLDGDLLYDFLYVHVPVNVSTPGNYRLEGQLQEGRNQDRSIAWAEVSIGETTGAQIVTLAFGGEQIRFSKMDGYYVEIRLISEDTWEVLDETEHFTTRYRHDEFEKPNAIIETPVEEWLVDSDFDGFYNLLVLNITLNVSEAGDYVLIGDLRDVFGDELEPEPEFMSFTLETGIQQVQISFEGTSIYNHGKNLGYCYLGLFDDMIDEDSEAIHALLFYTPHEYELFQHFLIDSYVYGYVTDIYDQPIENIEVMIYNITLKFLNRTKTNETGYYELGGWGGDWILVVDDFEDENRYQGNLSEITLVSGTDLNYDVSRIPYTVLDRIEMNLIFSDWNNTYLDWLLYAEGDNETIRFMFDVLQWGDGDGFLSEEEVEFIMGFLSEMSLPDNSNDSFMVDDIWYDLDPLSMTSDVGIGGPITSDDPVYIHMTGNYTANSTIPNPSPHELTLNCTYDNTNPGTVTDNNASYITYVAVPTGWGRTGNGVTSNVSISGSDYITVDSLDDPNPSDDEISEWVNITVSWGELPTYCSIKGNVTLQGSSQHSGVMIKVYDNSTQEEVASDPTNSNGYYEILGLAPGTYDIVAHKAGYEDNRSNGHTISAGEILWLDFTLYSYPPTISHNPVSSALVGDSIEIYADVTDDGQVHEVLLYYKEVGSISYTTTSMSRIASTSTFVGTIPQQTQAGYVYYYIWANDTKGNWAVHPNLGNHTILIYELDPPEFTNITIETDPVEYPDPVNISADIDDANKVITVSLFIEKPDSSTSNNTMLLNTSTGKYFLNASYLMLGTYNYTIWANDSFDNWNFSSGSFVVRDTLPPGSSVEPITTYWLGSSPLVITAWATDYSGIGVENVELFYQYSPDNSSPWTGWLLFGKDLAPTWSWDFDFPYGDGYYEFLSIANDSAGNPEPMKSLAEAICAYDTTSPTSSVNTITPFWQTVSPLTIMATALSDLIGIESVELWYRFSPDNSSWGSPALVGTDIIFPWSWDFYFPDGEGYYEFYSIATDFMSLSELAPSYADAQCAFDTSDPSILSSPELPDPWEFGQAVNISATFSDLSGIGGAWIELTQDSSLIGNYSMEKTGQDYWYVFIPDDVGTLDIIIWVKDNNDYWNYTSASSQVQDTILPSITDFTISPSNPEVESTVRVSVNVSDLSGINTCKINITTPDGDWLLNESMTKVAGTDNYYYETNYNLLGGYQVVIWVEDGNGKITSLSETVTTYDSEFPVANAGAEQAVTAGTSVTLDADLSSDNYGIANYTWEFNDNGLKRLYGESVSYTFNTAYDYKITLRVRDYGGNTDEAVTWVNVSAVSGSGTVTGTVLDENGEPVEGASVYVEGYPNIEDTTDSRGVFILENVPIGDRTIWVVKDGYQRYSQDVSVQQDQSTTTDDIALARSAAEEETPWVMYGALGAVIAVLVAILLLFVMKKMRQAKTGKTVIDEVFLMYDDGRLIKHFTRRLKPDMDEDILSSMLVAVQDFIKDSFRDQEGILDEMKFGRFQVLLGRGKHIILTTIILGDDPGQLRPQIAKCVDDIEEKFADVLEDWDGEMSKEIILGVSKYVMDLIDGRYA